jgi:hypothetical protein
VKARFKDPDLPVQRIVMILGLLLTAVRKLSDWLGTDALRFEFLLLQDKEAKPLAQEGALLEMLFREQIENQTVEIKHVTDDPATYADRRAQRSLCHLLIASADGHTTKTKLAVVTELVVDGPRPEPGVGYVTPVDTWEDGAFESWITTLERLLRLWV